MYATERVRLPSERESATCNVPSNKKPDTVECRVSVYESAVLQLPLACHQSRPSCKGGRVVVSSFANDAEFRAKRQ